MVLVNIRFCFFEDNFRILLGFLQIKIEHQIPGIFLRLPRPLTKVGPEHSGHGAFRSNRVPADKLNSWPHFLHSNINFLPT